MTESFKKQGVEKTNRNDLSSEIKKIRAKSIVAKPDSSLKYSPSDEIIRSKLLEYYENILNSIISPIEKDTDLVKYIDEQVSDIENLKKKIGLLLVNLVKYKKYKNRDLNKEYIFVFDRIFRKIHHDLEEIYNGGIKLPANSSTKAILLYKFGGYDDALFAYKFRKYRSEIYKYLSKLPVFNLKISQENIDLLSNIQEIEDVSVMLLSTWKYAFDKSCLEKYQNILDARPDFISCKTYFNYENKWRMYNLINGVIFGSQEQFEKIKLDLKKSLEDPENHYFIQDFFNKIVYQIFNLETLGLNFRKKVIELIAYVMEIDTELTSVYFYKWLCGISIISDFTASRLGDEIIKYIEIKKINPILPKELVEKLNIYCLARYSNDLILQLIDNYNEKIKPQFLSIIASNGGEGGLYQVGDVLDRVQNSLNYNGNVLIFEASTYFEIIRFLNKRYKEGFRSPSIIYISAHGDTDRIFLSEKNRGQILNGNINDKNSTPFLQYLIENKIKVILDSCLTGQGDESIQKTATRAGLTIIAPDNIVNNGTLIELETKNDEIVLKRVTFYSVKSKGGKIIIDV